jgi:biotin transport system substrate-specific component
LTRSTRSDDMSININFDGYMRKYRQAREKVFEARDELEVGHKIVLSIGFALLTALAAQIRIYLGFTPVPITLQVFVVLLAGIVLGKWWGGISQGMYIGMGAAGLPVFSNFAFGVETLAGVTGGYIFGFMVAAFMIGHIVDTYPRTRNILPLIGLMLLGIGVIYLLGVLQLAIVLSLTPAQALMFGAVPFIGGDVAKAIGASMLATAILPKKA